MIEVLVPYPPKVRNPHFLLSWVGIDGPGGFRGMGCKGGRAGSMFVSL